MLLHWGKLYKGQHEGLGINSVWIIGTVTVLLLMFDFLILIITPWICKIIFLFLKLHV